MPRVSGMRELKLLKVDGSNIREMKAESLKELPALRYFHLAQSKLTRLDIGVLEDLDYVVLNSLSHHHNIVVGNKPWGPALTQN